MFTDSSEPQIICLSLAFTSSTIFRFLDKDFRSAKTLPDFIISRHSLPKNDEKLEILSLKELTGLI